MINHTDKQGVLMFIHVQVSLCISSQKQQIFYDGGYFYHVNRMHSSNKFINAYYLWVE